jgi:hypothetical protein
MACTTAVTLTACGSSDDDTSPGGKAVWVTPRTPEDFPPPPEGYTRLEAPVIKALPAGGEAMECQYIRVPFERDLDVLDVRGYQTLGGHHAVVFASLNNEPVGTARECTDADNQNIGAFLGGPNGDNGESLPLPQGASFRVRQGQTIMLNTHFINTQTETVDGYTVIDIKFAEVDPSRTIASLFPVGGMQFEIPANGPGEFSGGCAVPERMQVIGISNHMHEFGQNQITEVVRANGEVVVLREDQSWSYDLQFAAEWDFWSVDDPFILEAGETIRTHCSWLNTTAQPLTYPREMCFGRTYVISQDAQMPVCFDGEFFKY